MVVFWSHTVSLSGEQGESLSCFPLQTFLFVNLLIAGCCWGVFMGSSSSPWALQESLSESGSGWVLCVSSLGSVSLNMLVSYHVCFRGEPACVSAVWGAGQQLLCERLWTQFASSVSDSSPPSAQAAGQSHGAAHLCQPSEQRPPSRSDVCGGHYAQTEDFRHISQSDHWRGAQESIGHVWNKESSCFPGKCTFIHPVI